MTAATSELRQHPLSAAFPAMLDNELGALALDIETNGQREPGVLFEGMVLDGWHRYLACEKSGVTFKSVEFAGADPVAFVLSHNLHRRHLTASQRAGCVVAAASWRPTGITSSRAAAAATLTNKSLAEQAEVGERTIRDAKAAHTAGLGEEVREGRISAERAARVARLPKGKREKALKEPAAPKKADDAKARAELVDVQGKYADLLEKHADLADTARELQDRLIKFETTEPDDQQKLIGQLQKKIVRLEGEVERVTRARNDCQNKVNDLIRQVKMERKKNGG